MDRVHLIGLQPQELPWIRLLVTMLRDSDLVVAELARQALIHVETVAEDRAGMVEPEKKRAVNGLVTAQARVVQPLNP